MQNFTNNQINFSTFVSAFSADTEAFSKASPSKNKDSEQSCNTLASKLNLDVFLLTNEYPRL